MKSVLFLSVLGLAGLLNVSYADPRHEEARQDLREEARQEVMHHGELFRFFRNPAGNLEYRKGHDHYAVNLGGIITSAPLAINHNDTIYIFARGTDGAIWYTTLHGGWKSLSGKAVRILEIYREHVYREGADIFIRVVGTEPPGSVWQRSLRTGWHRIR